MNVLEINNLNKEYSNFAIKNLNLTLKEGTIMGLIGENGAGKTTTLKAILDIVNNYTGEITIFGENAKNINAKLKENIGVVLDDMFYPEILTAEDIGSIMQGVYSNWDKPLFQKFLTDFNLPSKKIIKTFSKGMLKKLEIATSLAHHPKLLILDEPTNGLDPIARSEVIDIFREFMEDSHHSILLSTHITTDLEHIADYITLIDNGSVILSKTCDEILDNYGLVKCTKEEFLKIAPEDYLNYKQNKYAYELLVSNKQEFTKKYSITTIDKITLENLMILILKGDK